MKTTLLIALTIALAFSGALVVTIGLLVADYNIVMLGLIVIISAQIPWQKAEELEDK